MQKATRYQHMQNISPFFIHRLFKRHLYFSATDQLPHVATESVILLHLRFYCTPQQGFDCVYNSKKYLPWLERGRRVLGKTDSLSNTSNSPLYDEVPSSVTFSHLSPVSMKAENSASNPLGLIIHLIIKTAHFPSSHFPLSTTTFQ